MGKTEDLLLTRVTQDLKTITFRSLSRELAISVNEAKSQLALFHSSHASSCHPTWILTGTLLPRISTDMDVDEPSASQVAADSEAAQTVRLGVVLCTEEDIEEKKSLFVLASLSQHVYSLAPAILRDPSTLIAPSNLLRAHPKYLRPAIYGTSVASSIASGSGSSSTVASSSKKTVAAPEAKDKGKENEAAVAAFAPDKLKPKKAVAGTLDFSKNQSKEQKDEKKVADKKTTLKRKSSPTGGSSKPITVSVNKPAPAPSPPPAKASSSLKSKPKSRVVLSEDEDDEEAASVDVKPKKKQMSKADLEAEMKGLEEMMWDDMDVDDVGEDKAVETRGKAKATAAAPTKVKVEIDFSDDSDVLASKLAPKKAVRPNFKNKGKVTVTESDGDEDEPVLKPKKAVKAKKEGDEERRDDQGRLRKVRRVVKTVEGKNKRGYTVTEDTSEQESYYTSDDNAPPSPKPIKSKPKPAAALKPTVSSTSSTTSEKKPLLKPAPKPTGKKPPAGQTSMMSFFAKK